MTNINKENKNYAGFLLRLLCSSIDILINVLIIASFFLLLFLFKTPKETAEQSIVWFLSIFFVWGSIVYTAYVALFTSYFGGTVGKIVSGLKVVDKTGKKISDKRAFFRAIVGSYVASLLFGFGYLWILNDKNNQGWHDKVSDTFVIVKTSKKIINGVYFLLILLFLISSICLFIYGLNLNIFNI